MVKGECKEVTVSSKRLAKKESHFSIKTKIKETFPLWQPPHLLLCKKTLVSTATPLGLEVIPQVKKLLDGGLVRKSLNLCALLVPKIGIIRHQILKISDMKNVLSVETLFCKIIHAPNIFIILWIYVYMILMMPKKNQTRLLQRINIASRLIQDCFNKQSLASRFL